MDRFWNSNGIENDDSVLGADDSVKGDSVALNLLKALF